MEPNIQTQTTQQLNGLVQNPPPKTSVSQPNQAPNQNHSLKKYLIILGILEIPFSFMGIYILFPLLELQKLLKTNSISLLIGVCFFGLVLLVALLQILIGLFSLDLKLGRQKSKLLIGLGLLLAVMTIPAFIILIIQPIYGTIANIQ